MYLQLIVTIQRLGIDFIHAWLAIYGFQELNFSFSHLS